MNPGRVSRGFGFLLTLANRDHKAKEFMADWATGGPRTIQFELRGESTFYIRISNGRATLLQGRAESPDVVLRGTAKTFSRILSGEFDPDEAYSRQRFDIMGSIDDAIRFRYMSEMVQGSHSFLIGLLRRLFRIIA